MSLGFRPNFVYVDVDRVYERRRKASMPASCNHFTIY